MTRVVFLLSVFAFSCNPSSGKWNGKKCAVVLTYDDGLNVHLDKVVPLLDRYNIPATFYVHSDSESFKNRRDEWKEIAMNGHELGNHTVFHPCAGKSKGREWVKEEKDLDNYSVIQIISEINTASNELEKVDGKKDRTYAYTCGDTSVLDTSFVEELKTMFPAARGVDRALNSKEGIDLYDIKAYSINGHSSEEMIAQVEKAMETEALLVFLFHGVGGEHDLNADDLEHKKLVLFLNANKKDIWSATMLEAVQMIATDN